MSSFLAGPANKQGRICANNVVMGNVQQYNGAINTSIVKVFDMTVGTSGLHPNTWKAAGVDHIVSTIHVVRMQVIIPVPNKWPFNWHLLLPMENY